jgi:thiol-disulfide isomerase/thioredoxin
MRTNSRYWMGWILVAGLTNLGALAGSQITVGTAFPDLRGRDAVSYKAFKLKNLQGKVVLIDFWATWCGPCIHELPNVQKLYRNYHDRGLEIVSISLDTDLKKMRDFARDSKMNWHHLADGKGWKNAIAKECGVNSIPRMYLLDQKGVVIAADLRGYSELSNAVESALKGNKREMPKASGDTENEAQRMLKQAAELVHQDEIGPAVSLLRQIRKTYSGTTTADQALKELKRIAADPELKARAKAYLDREEAQEKLNYARELRDSGHARLAKKYFRQVIEKYPDTPEATEAASDLEKLP